MNPHLLEGRRILIAEDVTILAALLAELLSDLGCETVGPVPTAAEAAALAERNDLHGALLNVNLADGPILPAARVLESKQVPMIFVTANPEDVAEFRDASVVEKPYDERELHRAMLKAFAARRQAPSKGNSGNGDGESSNGTSGPTPE